MGERHKNIIYIINDLAVKKVFRNEEVALQFVKDIFGLLAKRAELIDWWLTYLTVYNKIFLYDNGEGEYNGRTT